MYNIYSKHYDENHVLFLQGQKGDTFWIILRGQVKIFVEDDKHSEQVKIQNMKAQGQEWCNNVMTEDADWLGREVTRINGGGFGELALFEGDGLRNASAATGKATDVILIPKVVYLRTLAYLHREAFITKRKITYLQQLPLFETWSKRRVINTAYTMERYHYSKGSVLADQNCHPDALMFIVVGEVRLIRMMDSEDVVDLQTTTTTTSTKSVKKSATATTSNKSHRQHHDHHHVAQWRGKHRSNATSEGHSSCGNSSNSSNKHGSSGKTSSSNNNNNNNNNNMPAAAVTHSVQSPDAGSGVFAEDVPTTTSVLQYINQDRTCLEPHHTRWKKPTMELSVFGKKSIIGLMAPKVYKLKQESKRLLASSRNDGSINVHNIKESKKIQKKLHAMKTSWLTIATQETEVFILSGKHLGTFCARSKGTNMFDVLDETYNRRLYSYKDRFRKAKQTKSFHGQLPPTRERGPFSPLRRTGGDGSSVSSSPGSRSIVVSMPSIMRKKLSKKNSYEQRNQMQKNLLVEGHGSHGSMFGGLPTKQQDNGSEEEDQLTTMRIRNALNKKEKEKKKSALALEGGKFVEFGADQQNRRSMALDRALDACLELHLSAERRKMLGSDA